MASSDHTAATQSNASSAPVGEPPPSGAPESRQPATAAPAPGKPARAQRLGRVLDAASAPIWIATAALFVISALVEPDSVRHSALLGMFPFAAVLAIAAMGQTLVIQQGGIDLSVPGLISITVVVVTHYPNGDDGKLATALLFALAIAVAAGLLTGLVVSWIGVTPIVATLGMNALLVGGALQISGGGTPRTTTNSLLNFASGKVAGVPNTVIVAVLLTAAVAFVIKKTVIGRRFEAVGAGLFGARAAGLEARRYQFGAYLSATILYCIAGVLLAGVVSTPSSFQGDSYLLPSVAAVVLGGTSLLGGRGSVVATAVAALFITQLDQFVLVTGAKQGVQNLVDAAALAAGIAIYSVPWRHLIEALRRRPDDRRDGVGQSAEVVGTNHSNQGAQLAPRPNE
jgi:ribose transport system permease protein